ncbi:MAG: transposase, partial [Alphaproteobacteria bacterium]|nr:transposase [Alphaproteobacteria bacterium]
MSRNFENFDFDTALSALQKGQALTGKDGVLMPLIKQLTEAVLAVELEAHLEPAGISNRKNGTTSKTVKSSSGSFKLDTPRDRAGSFEPQLVKKHQTHLTDEIESKILSMFGLGMSYRDITAHIAEIYALDISSAMISSVTDKIIPMLKTWQQRPLESIYPFVWLDAIHYKIKENGRYESRAVYTVLGLNMEGKKEILGLYISETEGA